MTANRVADYVDHMLEAAVQARAYVQGMSKAAFLADKRTKQAVILNLILIGEEATKLLKTDEAFADKYPQVPWRGMKGMRNRIAHGYSEIKLDTVRGTTPTARPELIQQLPVIRQTLP